MKKKINKDVWKRILKSEKILTNKEAEEMLKTVKDIRKKREDGFGISKDAEPFEEEEVGHKEFW